MQVPKVTCHDEVAGMPQLPTGVAPQISEQMRCMASVTDLAGLFQAQHLLVVGVGVGAFPGAGLLAPGMPVGSPVCYAPQGF